MIELFRLVRRVFEFMKHHAAGGTEMVSWPRLSLAEGGEPG